MTVYRLAFNGPTDLAPLNSLRGRIADILGRPDCDSIIVIFSSGGGSTFEALNFAEYLRILPVDVPFHAVGAVASAAVPLFMSAKTRTCSADCRFLFHNLEWGFSAGGKSTDAIEEAQLVLDAERAAFKKIATENTNIPPAKVNSFFGRHVVPTIVDAKQAKDWGIVNDVVTLKANLATPPNIAVWTVGW